MVSEMRARVRNLEQKIHTRVPRLRMGSITGRPNANTLAMSAVGSSALPSPVMSSSRSTSGKGNTSDERGSNLTAERHSADSIGDKKKTPSGDTSGWVLIMEDSPSPTRDNEKGHDRRRASSPSAPTAFRAMASTSASSPTLAVNGKGNPLHQSTINTGIRRPQSRLSGASLSTTATTSSIPTPTSRPATPTFLPVPSAGLYSHPSTAGVTGLKRSTGPVPSPYAQPKRSSLGASTAVHPTSSEGGYHRERPVTMPPPPRPASGTPASSNSTKRDRHNESAKALPQLPGLHSNITMRPPSKLPSSGTSNSLLSKSRIGRPSGGSSGRRSTGGDSDIDFLDALGDKGRTRAGSTSANSAFSRNGA